MAGLQNLPLILRGMVIGLAISVPIGPIAILCIQRTLVAGRIVGLVSGLGAATADAIYGAIAALGLAAIAEILIDQQLLLRVIGGLLLIVIGVRTLLSKPAENIASDGGNGLLGAYASTLVLTLTNPLTILIVATLFAGLGAAAAIQSPANGALLVVGVFLGSALWWLLLSGGVSLLRDRVTVRATVWVNRASGAIIALFGISALVAAISL